MLASSDQSCEDLGFLSTASAASRRSSSAILGTEVAIFMKGKSDGGVLV